MLERTKPNPIPSINPVPEYLVDGRTKELYEDTKNVLQVPWMGVITMALAHYLEFYETLWKAARPIMTSIEAVTACQTLRLEIEQEVQNLNPPKRYDPLREAGYAPQEINNIKETIEVFSHGNFPYTLMATLSRLALELDAFPPPSDATLFDQRHAPDVQVPFVLMEEHHADDQTKATYASVRENLELPFVNTDYRGLAQWPTYFRLVWSDLAPIVKTQEYDAVVTNIHHRFVEASMKLPNPTGTIVQDLKEAANRSASINEVLAVSQLFQWLLPGLITNVAFFREQLQ